MEGSFGPHPLRLKVLHDNSSYPLCKLPQKFHSLLNLQSVGEGTSSGKSTATSGVVVRISSANDSKNEFYAVWGGQFSDKQAEDVIEVSVSAIIQSNRSPIAKKAWERTEIVSIHFLPSVSVADRIHLRPESSFDWDIVSTQAVHVENQLLRSLAVVQAGQLVSIAVSSSLKAHFLIERVETASSSSLSVARVASGTELMIAPFTDEEQPTSRIVSCPSGIIESKKEAVLTVPEMINKLSKVDICTASKQYLLRVLPQIYRSQPTAYNLNVIDGKAKGSGRELMTDDYLDALLDIQSLTNYTQPILDDATVYPWSNVPLKDDEFTVYVHSMFIASILETTFDCAHVTNNTLASFMQQANYHQWVGIIHTDHANSCVVKVVATDMIREGHVTVPMIVRKQLLLHDFTAIKLELIIRSRAIIPDGILLRPVTWSSFDNAIGHQEEKDKVMRFLKQYNMHHQQQSIAQVNPIIAALIRLVDESHHQPSAFASGGLLLSQGSIVRLSVHTGQPPTAQSSAALVNRRRSRQLTPLSSSLTSAAGGGSSKVVNQEALDFSGVIHFEVSFINSSTPSSTSSGGSSNKDREYMLLSMSDDEEMLYESLSNIRIDTSTLQEQTLPYSLQTQLYDFDHPSHQAQSSKVMEGINGHEVVMKQVLLLLSQSFLPYSVKQRITKHILPPLTITIEGQKQSGKTTILQVINHILHTSNSTLCHVIHLDGKKLKPLSTSDILQTLTQAFRESQDKAPAMISIDNIEFVCPKFGENSSIRDEKTLLVAIHLSRLLSDLYHERMIHELICQEMIVRQDKSRVFGVEEVITRSLQHAVVVVLAVEDVNLLDDSLLHWDRLSTVIKIPSLLAEKKLALLQLFLSKENISLPNITTDSDKRLLCSRMEGFVIGDIVAIKRQVSNKIARKRFADMTTDALQQLLAFDTIILDSDNSNSNRSKLIEDGSINSNNSFTYDDNSSSTCLSIQELLQVLHSYTAINASALGSNSRFASKPSSTTNNSNDNWKQIAGYQQVKQQLTQVLQHPIIFRRLFAFSPLPLPRAVLLFGPPGCGKTFLAQAAGLAFFDVSAFFAVRGPQLLDKYIGASEKAVRELFTQAGALKRPCLLFFDEFEALAPRRGKDNTGVTDRIVNQLLTFIDGVEGRGTQSLLNNDDDDTDSDDENSNKSGQQQMFFIMAASSRPDLIDPALLRPGRIEQHVYLGYPTADDAKSILWKQLQQIPGSTVNLTSIDLDNVINEIAHDEKCRLMTPADLKAVVDSAYLIAVHEHLDSRRRDADTNKEKAISLKVTAEHLKKAFDDTRPSISLQDRQFYENIHHRFQRSGSKDKSSNGYTNYDQKHPQTNNEGEVAVVGSQVIEEAKGNRNNKKKKKDKGEAGNGNKGENNNNNGILDQKFILK